MTRTLPAIHPGEVLREEFMLPMELNANQLAQSLDVPPNRITSIGKGTRSVTADTAMRLGAYFDTSPLFWMNLQRDYDLEVAEAEKGAAIRKRIAKRPAKPRPTKRTQSAVKATQPKVGTTAKRIGARKRSSIARAAPTRRRRA